MNLNKIIITIVIATSFLFIFLMSKNEDVAAIHLYQNLNDSVKYVGIDQCKLCHYDKYETYIQTGMGKSFNVASKQKSAANFNDSSVIYDEYSNLFYKPFWKDSLLFIKEFRLNKNDTTHIRVEQVDYIIGSGQHTNSHIFSSNGYFCQLPFTYYTQTNKLDLPPGFENGNNTRFSRKIGLECMSCHNGYSNFNQGSEHNFSSVLNGIDCERCHGPGEIHVKEKMAEKIVDTSMHIDYTILNPKDLSGELQMQICQRCHLQGNTVLKDGKSFFDFMPGMMLNEVMEVYLPKYTNSEDDFLMASHVERFKLSKCYLNSKDDFLCTSCHNPHISVKELSNNYFNTKCNSCHYEKSFCSAKTHVLSEENFDCVKCHMKKSSSIDIPHVSITDHHIKIPVTKKKQTLIRKFAGLHCVNNNNPSTESKAKAYLQQYEKFTKDSTFLDSAVYYIKKSNSSPTKTHLKTHYFFLKKDYLSIVDYAIINNLTEKLVNVSYDNQDAWTCYRIASSFYNLNFYVKAKTYFEKSVSLAPLNLDFKNELAGTLIKLNELDSAKKILNNIVEMNPKYEKAYCNLGVLYAMSNRHNLALEQFNKAIALNPNYGQAIKNKEQLIASEYE